jgi:diguanylate cyclase (GGDEF)-like protein
MGGDEFAAFLPGHDRKQATALLEEVLEAMRTSSVVAASGVTVSIGGISRKPCSTSLDLLIHQADKLMYGVKQDGRNAVRIVDEDS